MSRRGVVLAVLGFAVLVGANEVGVRRVEAHLEQQGLSDEVPSSVLPTPPGHPLPGRLLCDEDEVIMGIGDYDGSRGSWDRYMCMARDALVPPGCPGDGDVMLVWRGTQACVPFVDLYRPWDTGRWEEPSR